MSAYRLDLATYLVGGAATAAGRPVYFLLLQLTSGRPAGLQLRLDLGFLLAYGYDCLPSAHELPAPAYPRHRGALRADRASGTLHLPDGSRLVGLPDECWQYELGGKAALEHLLGGWRARVRQPKDATLRAHFPNPSGFTAPELRELKDQVARFCTLCVQHVAIVNTLGAVSPLNPANHPPGWQPAKAAKPAPAPRLVKPPRPVQATLFPAPT